MTPTVPSSRLVAILIVSLGMLLGFASGGSAHAAAIAVPSGDDPAPRVLSFTAQLQAMADDLYTRVVGDAPAIQYGTLRLASPVRIDGDPYSLEVVVGLEYADGTGPWSGFMTLASREHGTLAMAFTGRTTRLPDGASRVLGRMTVIGGTGGFTGYAGGGITRAYRDGAPGSPTSYRTTIALRPGTVPPAAEVVAPLPVPSPSDALTVTLTGVPGDQHFTTLPDGTTYGIGRLVGDATGITAASGAYATRVDAVELLGVVDYVDGAGPFAGFITLSAADGSDIGMRYAGVATRGADGSTAVLGELEVIASDGAFAGMRGTGSVTGTRAGVVGAPLTATVSLRLRQARGA